MASAEPQRRRARSVRKSPASESEAGVVLKVGQQISMLFPASSSLAGLVDVSTRATLQAVIDELQAEAEKTSAFGEWCDRCLARDARGVVDQDTAFVSFWRYCDMVGLTGADRLSHREFVIAMTAAGHPLGVSRDGRRFHRGCRLDDRFGGVIPARGVGEVGLFIAEKCLIGGNSIADRGRSLAIYQEYRSWAIERGDKPLSIVRFAKALKERGFRRIHSDGRYWQGLRLAQPSASGGSPEKGLGGRR